MSGVLAVQPTATLDEFLADPVTAEELGAAIEKADLSVKGPKRVTLRGGEKRERYYDTLEMARALIAAWREHRP